MTAEYHRLLLIFVDGVGLAADTPDNPLAQLPTPGLKRLLGGPLTLAQCWQTDGPFLAGVDANLDVPGLPQSATGPAVLSSGINVAKMMGRHVSGLPGPRVRALVESKNLFSMAVDHGPRSTFANSYTRDYLDSLAMGRRGPSVTTCAVLAGDLPVRGSVDLEHDRAVSWDLLRDRFSEKVEGVLPLVTASEAGRHLATIARDHALTIYETFITDMAGHGRLGFSPAETLARIGGLIDGVIEGMGWNMTLLLTSDHGNLEESDHRRHTRNPVPLLVVGPLASCFADVTSVLGVTPRILE